jgi:hypothetical protein
LQSVCDQCTWLRHGGQLFELTRGVRTRSRARLLEHGILCCGPVTPSGCGGLCPARDAPCIGCGVAALDAPTFEATVLTCLGSRLGREGAVVDRCVEAGLLDPIGRLREYHQARLLLRPLVQRRDSPAAPIRRRTSSRRRRARATVHPIGARRREH